jgi:hypothetical protein
MQNAVASERPTGQVADDDDACLETPHSSSLYAFSASSLAKHVGSFWLTSSVAEGGQHTALHKAAGRKAMAGIRISGL